MRSMTFLVESTFWVSLYACCRLITDQKALDKLKSSDRYDPAAKDGISPRWIPGSKAATYNAQGDEHDGAGNIDETGPNAIAQMEKRMKKVAVMKAALPEPELFQVQSAKCKVQSDIPELDILVVSWGSNKGAILDSISEKLEALAAKAKKTIFVEASYQGQLAMLIKMECGLEFDHKILKYDGRPFFVDELLPQLVS